MKKTLILFMLLGLLAFTGCTSSASASDTLPETTQAVEVAKGIEVWGEVVAGTEKEITIDFPALVSKVFVKEGDSVKKEDTLLEIDYSDYNSKILQKEKEVELAKATLTTLIKDTTAQTKEINGLKEKKVEKENLLNDNEIPEIKILDSSFKNYNEELLKAQNDYNQQKQLFDSGAISKVKLEEYKKIVVDKQKSIEDTKYSIEKIKLEYQNAIKDLDTSIQTDTASLSSDAKTEISNINTQNIKIELAELQLEELKNKINKTYLKGDNVICELPEGIVKEVTCKEGSIISDKQVVLKLIDNGSIVVRADVPEEFISTVTIGAVAEITPYADKTKTLTGKVVSIANSAVKENGETIIKVDIVTDEKSNLIKPGFSVDVKILD